MPTTIVTILSTNYAGSHFLSLLLGSHSQACHIGEVRRAVRGHRGGGEMGLCHLCNPPSNCPTVRNLDDIKPDDVYSQVLSNLADDGLRPKVLIDTSKRVDWAGRVMGHAEYQYKYIHLIRDPRAFVRRYLMNCVSLWSRTHLRRQAMFRGAAIRPYLLFSPQWKICLERWYDKNVEIADFLQRRNCDHQLVTYHDLATDTAGELSRLTNWMGLAFEPKQVEYWMFDHHGSQKLSYEWIKQQRTTGHLDVRWKDFLSPDVAHAIAEHRDVRRLLDRLSLTLGETGLSRKDRVPATRTDERKPVLPVRKAA